MKRFISIIPDMRPNSWEGDWSVSIGARGFVAFRAHVRGPKAMKGYFTPRQARGIAQSLLQFADQAER